MTEKHQRSSTLLSVSKHRLVNLNASMLKQCKEIGSLTKAIPKTIWAYSRHGRR